MRKILALLSLAVLFLVGCSSAPSGFVEGFFAGVVSTLGLWYIFWPLTVVAILLIGYFVEDKHDHILGSIIWLVILLALFKIAIYDFHPIDYMHNNPWKVLFIIAGYVAMMICWPMIKLRVLGNRHSKQWAEEKARFLAGRRNEDEWHEYVNDHSDYFEFSRQEHKIFSWAIYWPFSVVWFFLNDFLREVWDFIYHRLKKAYRYVYESAIGNILDDSKKAKEMIRGKKFGK